MDAINNSVMGIKQSINRFNSNSDSIAKNGPEPQSMVGIIQENTNIKAMVKVIQTASENEKRILDIIV